MIPSVVGTNSIVNPWPTFPGHDSIWRFNRTGTMARVAIAGTCFAVILLMAVRADADQFDPVRARIRTVMASSNISSVTVAVAQNGKIVWEEGFGFADVEKRIPATPHTPYLLASISKPITATALMILSERGAIDIEKPMNDYLGQQKLTTSIGRVEDATVRRVADHTAGLPIHIRFFYQDGQTQRPSLDETIRRYGVLVRPPGESYDYSNLDYGLLEYAIERTSGKSYSAFLQKEVFDPLGLSDSAVSFPPNISSTLATRYWGDHVVPPYDYDARGSAAVSMSAHDLVRFGMFHLQGRLDGQRKAILRESTLTSMRDTRALNNGKENNYGIGWMVEERHGLKWFGHGGGQAGVATWLSVFPDAGVVVVVLGNGVSVVGAVHSLENDIVHAVLPDTIRYDHGFKPEAKEIGVWAGLATTYSGQVPIKLDFRGNGSVFARIGTASWQEVTSVSLDADTSILSLDNVFGDVGTADASEYPYRLQFALKFRTPDSLNGAIIANSAETLPDRMGNALSYWVDLHREESSPPGHR
jgi:CubicO group peptidase (beta-lactamase class C family)